MGVEIRPGCSSTVQLVFFLFNSHPSQWGGLFYPLQSRSGLHSNITCNFITCTPWSPYNPTVFPPKWVESQWGIKLQSFPLGSSKTKYLVIHPTLKLHRNLTVFSLQCFHRNGWNHSGVRNFNPFCSFCYQLGWVGNWKTARAVLYVINLNHPI